MRAWGRPLGGVPTTDFEPAGFGASLLTAPAEFITLDIARLRVSSQGRPRVLYSDYHFLLAASWEWVSTVAALGTGSTALRSPFFHTVTFIDRSQFH